MIIEAGKYYVRLGGDLVLALTGAYYDNRGLLAVDVLFSNGTNTPVSAHTLVGTPEQVAIYEERTSEEHMPAQEAVELFESIGKEPALDTVVLRMLALEKRGLHGIRGAAFHLRALYALARNESKR